MLRFMGAAALAATLSFGPVAGVGNSSTPLQPIRAIATVQARQTYAAAVRDLTRIRQENQALRERARQLRSDAGI